MSSKRKPLGSFSAYHGGSWRPRTQSHSDDCRRLWSFQGINSEYGKLKEVLLYTPPRTPSPIHHPEKVQHLRKIDWKKLRREQNVLARLLESRGITVRRLEADWFANAKPNLMFVRDQFFMTPWGAILGRMASPVRAGEEAWAQLALAKAGIPILHLVRGRGTFEGADALWISPDSVLVGLGNRTNKEGYLQLKKVLAEFQVETFSVRLPKNVQHLLGLLQLVGPRAALLRDQIAPASLKKILQKLKYEVIQLPEIDEVSEMQGMNILTIAPRHVIMPTGCGRLKTLLSENGIRIVAEIPISQLINAAGGIACATNALSRSLFKAPFLSIPEK